MEMCFERRDIECEWTGLFVSQNNWWFRILNRISLNDLCWLISCGRLKRGVLMETMTIWLLYLLSEAFVECLLVVQLSVRRIFKNGREVGRLMGEGKWTVVEELPRVSLDEGRDERGVKNLPPFSLFQSTSQWYVRSKLLSSMLSCAELMQIWFDGV